jgi:hypothetical protein
LVPAQSATAEGEVDITFSAPQATASATQIIANYIVTVSMSPSLATAKATDVVVERIVNMAPAGATAQAQAVIASYTIEDAPELIITNVTATTIVFDVTNPQVGFSTRLYEAEVSAGSFATYSFKQNITNASLPVTINYGSTSDINRKFKAVFRHLIDTNVTGPQSGVQIVVGYTL